MQGRQHGNVHVEPRKRRKGKYENDYVANRINEIRAAESMYVDATDEYPRELKGARWAKLKARAFEGMSPMQMNNAKQCAECGGVFHRGEFRTRARNTPPSDVCRKCRPKVASRERYRTLRAERLVAEAAFSKNSVATRAASRAEAINTGRKQYTARARANKDAMRELQRKIDEGRASERTYVALARRRVMLDFHNAVRKAMEDDYKDPHKAIATAHYYFDELYDLRERHGMIAVSKEPLRDLICDVVVDSDVDEFDVLWGNEVLEDS